MCIVWNMKPWSQAEGQVFRLVDRLDLAFEPACLRFLDNPRAVDTPSAQQVCEPVNRKGIGRWRNYEPWLTPLKEELGSVPDHSAALDR